MIGGVRSIKIGVLAKVLIITWVCHVMMHCFRPININVLATLLSTVSAQRGEERTAQRRREQSVVRERERQSEREEERERETEKDIVSTKRSSPPLALCSSAPLQTCVHYSFRLLAHPLATAGNPGAQLHHKHAPPR